MTRGSSTPSPFLFDRQTRSSNGHGRGNAGRLARAAGCAIEHLELRTLLSVSLNYGGTGTALTLTEVSAAADNVTISEPVVGTLRIDLNGANFSAGSATTNVTYEVDGDPTTSTFATIDVSATNAVTSLTANLDAMDDALWLDLPDANGAVGDVAIDGGAGNDVVRLGEVTIGGSLAVTAESISVNGELTTTGAVALTSTGGDGLAVNAGIDPASITITSADDIVINAPLTATDLIQLIAGTDGTGSVIINAAGSVSQTTAGKTGIQLIAGATTGDITLQGTVSAADALTMTAHGTLAINGSASGAPVTLTADDMAINAVVNAGGGVVTLQQFSTNRAIDLGTNSAGNLGLTQAELNEVTASVLRIGNDGTTFSGALFVSAPIAGAASFSNTLSLRAPSGNILQNPAGTLSVTNLAAQAGAVFLTNPGNTVTNLAGSTRLFVQFGFQFTNSANLNVTTVDGVIGIRAVNPLFGDVVLNGAGSTSLTVSQPIITPNGRIQLNFDDMAINAAVIAPSLGLFAGLEGLVQLAPVTAARAIDLGTNTAGQLGLTDTELDQITAGVALRIGSSSNTGGVVVSGPISAPAAGYSTMHLISSAGVVDGNAAGADITVANLAIEAGSGIGSADDLNLAVTSLAFSNTGGSVAISNTGALTIGTVDGITGATNTGTSITVSAASPLTVIASIIAPGDISLTAGETNDPGTFADHLVVTLPGTTVQSTGGNILLRAGDLVGINGGTQVLAPAGSVQLIAGYLDADGNGDLNIVGAVSALNDVTLTAAVGVANVLGSITASSITQNSGPGASSYTGTMTALGAGGINLTGDKFVLNGTVVITAAGSAVTVDTTGLSILSGSISGAGGFIKKGSGTVTVITAAAYTGITTIIAGTFNVNGSLAPSSLVQVNAGVLGGTGTVSNMLNTSGTVHPGVNSGPGILTATASATFTPASTFQVVLNGNVAGTGYSQLVSTGPTNLGGANLTGTLGYAPSPLDTLVIVHNAGIQNTVGTFAQGGTITIGGKQFVIDYTYAADGDGLHNDVALLPVGSAIVPDPADPSKTALIVTGTAGDDNIQILSAGGSQKVNVVLNGVVSGPFAPTGHIIVLGRSGNDTITVEKKVNIPALLYGEDGNDKISTGNGSSIAVGGSGNDTAAAGNSNDILIGGTGADVLNGDNGSDILIGGFTSYDSPTSANEKSLIAIQNEWNAASYAKAVAHISGATPGGLNGSNVFNATTVFDDATRDSLFGGNGQDWFLLHGGTGATADVSDAVASEIRTLI